MIEITATLTKKEEIRSFENKDKIFFMRKLVFEIEGLSENSIAVDVYDQLCQDSYNWQIRQQYKLKLNSKAVKVRGFYNNYLTLRDIEQITK